MLRGGIGKGIGAGLIAGVIFGIMMQAMTAPAPGGGEVSMMVMVAMILGSQSLVTGWIYHLFNSAIIGAIYGLMITQPHTYGSGLLRGSLYGLFWWFIGGMLLMPLFLGMPALAPLILTGLQGVAFGSLVGHLVYGLVLGGCFVWLTRPRESLPPAAGTREVHGV
jgi:uncharacterized membrane protein YagU involved in acid resistance